jgi:hypothetical protein
MAKKSLEDFLAKPKERSNYVEASPEKNKPKFHKNGDVEISVGAASREETPKKGVKAAQTEKVTETVLPAQPEVKAAPIIPPEPIAAPPVPAPIAEEVTTKETTTSAPQEAAGPSVWERAMVGATPLLVGWLSGNMREGLQVSGDHMVKSETDLYKREMDLDTKIREMKAKRDLAGTTTKNPAQKTIEYMDSNGKTRIGRLVNGQFITDEKTDPLASIKPGTTKWITKQIDTPQGPKEVAYNPDTQEIREIGNASVRDKFAYKEVMVNGKPTLVAIKDDQIVNQLGESASASSLREDGKNERQLKQIRVGLLKDITKPTSVYSQRRDQLEGMVKAAELLNSGGPIGGSGLRMILARSVFGEKGPLSDGDVSRLSGDPAAQRVVDAMFEKYLAGNINDADRMDIRRVIDIAAKLAQEDANRYLDSYVQTYKAESPDLDLTTQLNQFRDLPSLPAHRRGSMKQIMRDDAKGTAAAQVKGLNPGTRDGDYEYVGGDPGKKESWKKVK